MQSRAVPEQVVLERKQFGARRPSTARRRLGALGPSPTRPAPRRSRAGTPATGRVNWDAAAGPAPDDIAHAEL